MQTLINEPLQRKAYSATEVAAVLGVSKSFAYRIMGSDGFPLIRVGSRKLVSIERFDNWLRHSETISLPQQAQPDSNILDRSCAEREGLANDNRN